MISFERAHARYCAPILVAAALALAACGNSEQATDEESPATQAEAGEAASGAEASADGAFFDPALTRPRCPARTSGGQGPDVLDVKLGMSRDEALAVLHCQRRDFHVRRDDGFFGTQFTGDGFGAMAFAVLNGRREGCDPFALENSISGGRCDPGASVYRDTTETISVETPGIMGEERVLRIRRHQRFEEGQAPASADAIAAIVRKYGEPMQREDSNGGVALRWAWDPSGAPLSTGNPLFRECTFNLARADGRLRVSEGCGQTLIATVSFARNRGLTRELYVELINQAALLRAGEAMEARQQAQTDARQRDEVERARGADVDL